MTNPLHVTVVEARSERSTYATYAIGIDLGTTIGVIAYTRLDQDAASRRCCRYRNWLHRDG